MTRVAADPTHPPLGEGPCGEQRPAGLAFANALREAANAARPARDSADASQPNGGAAPPAPAPTAGEGATGTRGTDAGTARRAGAPAPRRDGLFGLLAARATHADGNRLRASATRGTLSAHRGGTDAQASPAGHIAEEIERRAGTSARAAAPAAVPFAPPTAGDGGGRPLSPEDDRRAPGPRPRANLPDGPQRGSGGAAAVSAAQGAARAAAAHAASALPGAGADEPETLALTGSAVSARRHPPARPADTGPAPKPVDVAVVRRETHFAPVPAPPRPEVGVTTGPERPPADGSSAALGLLAPGDQVRRALNGALSAPPAEDATDSRPHVPRPTGAMPAAPGAGPLRVLEIQLHPATLGTVSVAMRLSPLGMKVSVSTSLKETAERLQEDRGELVDLFRRAGYDRADVTVEAARTAPDDGAEGRRPGERNRSDTTDGEQPAGVAWSGASADRPAETSDPAGPTRATRSIHV